MIDGWTTEAELAWLSAHAKAALRIVEIGAWKGRSTVALASTPGAVWAVDTWDGAPDDPATNAEWYPDAATAYDEFRANVAGLPVVALRATSLEAVVLFRVFDGGLVDMVFIDADHRYEAVTDDIQAWRALLKPGGLLCGHDYHPRCPGVIQAVNELLPHAVIGPDSIWSVTV